MWTVIFAIVSLICGIGWLSRYISTAAMIYYINKKGYIQPDDNEIKECTMFVVKHIFSDLTRTGL